VRPFYGLGGQRGTDALLVVGGEVRRGGVSCGKNASRDAVRVRRLAFVL